MHIFVPPETFNGFFQEGTHEENSGDGGWYVTQVLGMLMLAQQIFIVEERFSGIVGRCRLLDQKKFLSWKPKIWGVGSSSSH